MKVLIYFLVVSILACAPKDRPLKGSKNSPQSDNRIQESAYNGSKLEVAAFSSARLLEPHRILSMALLWQKTSNRVKLEATPGYSLLKSCWGGRNDVYIDVLQDEPHLVVFVLNFDNCTSLASFQASTKVHGREFYTLHFDTLTNGTEIQRGALKSLDYKTVNFSHTFKANDKNLRYTNSSHVQLNETREMSLVRRNTGEYYFAYSSLGHFEQNMLSPSFRLVEEKGLHNFFADGNFTVIRHKVRRIRHANIELKHTSPRAIYLRKGSARHIFTNENNKIEFRAAIGETGASFDTACGYLNGDLQSIEYVNHNEKRNQFFEKLDGSVGEELKIRGEIVKGRDNKVVLQQKERVLAELPAKCYISSSNITKLVQPKTPFDLLFLK